MMNRIIESVEKDRENYDLSNTSEDRKDKKIDTTQAITSAAYSISQNAQAKAIITFSVSGKTTLRMSKQRALVQIVGISPNLNTSRRLQIAWGVNSCHAEDANDVTEMVRIACTIVKKKEIAKPNDAVVITAGIPFGNAGGTNLLRIAKIIADEDLS